jgi:AP-1 complex subunit beta-1
VIPTLAENLDALDDPAARASLIWMVGEYAEKITNAGQLLETFLESFKDEPTPVRPLFDQN